MEEDSLCSKKCLVADLLMDVAVTLLVLVVAQLVHLPSLFLFFFTFYSFEEERKHPKAQLVLFLTYKTQISKIKIQASKNLPTPKEDNMISENLHENPYVPNPKNTKTSLKTHLQGV
jgi:hypothetical protein